MPIISKKQEIELSFTNIIINGDNETETEIDFDLYNDVNNKLRLKASKNKKLIFDWPLESIQEINDFISSKLKFNIPSKEKTVAPYSPVENYLNIPKKAENRIASVPIASPVSGGAQELESFINSKNNNQGVYSNSSSLISSQAFMSALAPDNTYSDNTENERINRVVKGFDSVEIDLEVDIDKNEDISSGKEDQDGI